MPESEYDFNDDLLGLVRSLGFDAKSYTDQPPAGAVYTLTWKGQFGWKAGSVRVWYFEGAMHRNDDVISTANYNIFGTGHPDPISPADDPAEALRPLVVKLLKAVPAEAESPG